MKLTRLPPLIATLPPRLAVATDTHGHSLAAEPWRRLYRSARWLRERAEHLDAHPLCLYCEAGAFANPQVVAANTVDHFWPHRGDERLFWARPWWCSSCPTCHAGPKQALERRGEAALAEVAARLGLPPR